MNDDPTLKNSTLLRFAKAALADDSDPQELPWEEIDLSDPDQRRFGDYELLELLGRGGMGVVYRARHARLDREVAIKFIACNIADQPEVIGRFMAEAQAAAKLHHPNIVPVFEVGSVDCLYYFTMPLLRGKTLADLGRLSMDEAVAMMRKLCSAVSYAHSLGLLHLDLKPTNVMIDEHGRPMIGDFGLARQMDDERGVTAQEVSGTPAFMAPEQVQIKQFRLTEATDLYALGAMLYQLLSGQSPHGRGSAQELMQKATAGRIPDLRSLDRSIPKDLAAICAKCLELMPKHRYASVAELDHDLARFVDGTPVSVRRPSWPERVRRSIARNPKLAVAMGLAVLALLVGFLTTSWQWREAEKARQLAEDRQGLAEQRAVRMRQLAQMIAVIHPNSDNADDEIKDPGRELVAWLKANGGTPEDQRELLRVFVEAMERAGKDRALDEIIYEVLAQMSREYRAQLGRQLAQRSDRDSLLTAALLLMDLEDDGPVKTLLERIDRDHPEDPLAVFVVALICERTTVACLGMELRDRLRALAPDTGLAWMYGFGDGVMDGEALAGLAAVDRIDDRLDEMTKLVRDAVAAQPPPPEVMIPLEATLTPQEAATYARWAGSNEVPVLPFHVLLWPCHPERDEFRPQNRDECLEIGRTLFNDEQNSIISRMIGSVILRRLAKGTAEAEAAFEFRRQYVWILEQTRKAGHQVGPLDVVALDDQLIRDMETMGAWPAHVAWAKRLGVPAYPPEDWVPKDSEALLLPEDRPSRQ